MAELKIENFIVSADIGREIDPEALIDRYEKAEYVPDRFPGVIVRGILPNATVLIFKSGRTVVTGIKSLEDGVKALHTTGKKLDIPELAEVGTKDVSVINIVASADLGVNINLEDAKAVLEVDGLAEYNPKEIDAVVFKDIAKAVAVLVFENGKLVVTGARDLNDANSVADTVISVLNESGVAGGELSP